ncbi:MAG: hypothetical protein GX149_04120 [Acholeplasmataceae bacterium]|nr:hypothetical protein [Acholeplasmataceae bacterium]
MNNFILHFFKAKTRQFDYEKLLSFFDEIPETEVEEATEDSTELRILYRNPVLKSEANFVISRKSTVREIHKLDPQYLDVNFRLEVPLRTPNFNAKFIFKIARDLAEEFEFAVFNSLFEDVLNFRMEVVERVFELTKEHYKEKHGYKFENVYFYPEEELNDCLKYVNEQYDLQRYYKEQNVYVPNYYIVVDESKKVYFAIEWEENKRTVFPPHIKYIYYHTGFQTVILPYDEVMAKIEKFTTNVPGFIQNTKVIAKKQHNRVSKAIRRTKFSQVEKTLIRIDLSQIIDF